MSDCLTVKSLLRSKAIVLSVRRPVGVELVRSPGPGQAAEADPSRASTTAMLESNPRGVSPGFRIAKAILVPLGDHEGSE